MTARVVIAAENRSLSLGLAGMDYDVIDLRPDQFDSWLGEADTADVLVVSVDNPSDALDLANRADAHRPGMAVLLVAGDGDGWSSLTQGTDLNAQLLPLPVSRLSLVAAVERLRRPTPQPQPEPELAVEPQVEPEAPSLPPPVAADAVPAPESDRQPAEVPAADPTQDTPVAPHRMVAARSTDALRERLAHTPHPHQSYADDISQLAPSRLAQPSTPVAPAASPVVPRVAVEPPQTETPRLVRDLLGRVGQLHDVRDTAHALVEEAASATEATSGVVMLPDEGVWRVYGAVGVRPLEWRYVVEPDSWLITTVVDGDRGVIVEDSDIARQRLGGAPLSHHKQLMVAPVPGARGLVIVARDAEPFGESQLTALAVLAVETGPMMVEALMVRDLARALSEFRGVDD